MKTRIGFVSNSSSSSFVVQKKDLTPVQIYLIKNSKEFCDFMQTEGLMPSEMEYDLSYYHETWNIHETDCEIYGDTMMDNFDMGEYLRFIGIDEDKFKMDRDA